MKNRKKEIQNSLPKDQNELPKDLPAPIQNLLNLIPETKRSLAEKQIEFLCYEYRGVIPSPDDLRKYNEIIPNGADRLTKMAEEQSAHRQNMESKVIRWQIFQSISGQWMAFIIAIFAYTLTYLLANSGNTEVACILASTTIVGLVSVFIFGKRRQKRDLEKKN